MVLWVKMVERVRAILRVRLIKTMRVVQRHIYDSLKAEHCINGEDGQ